MHSTLGDHRIKIIEIDALAAVIIYIVTFVPRPNPKPLTGE